MHAQGQERDASKSSGQMPLTDDEIREKYLDRAIRELNSLAHEIYGCTECPRGNLMPVLGAGHPQADIFLLKHSAQTSEVEEGVAFYGRSGTALTKSLNRLGIDPLAVYGTLTVKCPVEPGLASPTCTMRVLDEIMIVNPRLIVAMGAQAIEDINDLGMPGAAKLEPKLGAFQSWTAHCQALMVPDLDLSLDDDQAKRDFWHAFRKVGAWYDDLPPY